MKKRSLFGLVVKIMAFGLFFYALEFFYHAFKFQKGTIKESKKTILCHNVLTNLSKGKWILTSQNKKKIQNLDNMLRNYRIEVGLPSEIWRKDRKCGTSNINLPAVNKSWPEVGAWCDANGKFPCCSDKQNGICNKPSSLFCSCPDCVDTRKYLHPEMSEWQAEDPRCRWKHLNRSEACDAIEKSRYNEIYFIGDSFVRNMYMTMLTLLSDDPVRALWNKSMTETAKKKCIPPQMLFWKACRKLTSSTDDLLNTDALCRGRPRHFRLFLRPYHSEKFAEDFLNVIKQLLGKKGSLILLSIGYHIQCSSETAINLFLEAGFHAIRTYYARFKQKFKVMWPQLIFLAPMSRSLLSPPEYSYLHNNELIDEYTKNMSRYCRQQSIPLIDFRLLGNNAHSFDGTHYGFAVNMMKNQIFLNFLLNQI